MADKPIIFSAPMIQALLDGRKTQTRRIIRDYSADDFVANDSIMGPKELRIAAKFRVGDRLWVREAFSCDGQSDGECLYRATVDEDTGYYAEEIAEIRWRPSIHMPRWASRLTLIVTDVRVQRLQEISEADAVAEGIDRHGDRFSGYGKASDQWMGGAIDSFASLWTSIHGPEAWDANPWVCALTFTVHKRNIDSLEAAA